MEPMKKQIDTIEEARAFVEALHEEKKYVIWVRSNPDGIGFIVNWQIHKTFITYDGKEFPDEVWQTEAGDLKLIQDIEPEHCRNILRMILRQEREDQASMSSLAAQMAEALGNLKETIETATGIDLSEPKHILH